MMELTNNSQNIKSLNRIILILIVFTLFNFVQMDMMDAIGSFLLKTQYLSKTLLGEINAAFFYFDLLFIPFVGLVLDKFNIRKIMMTSIALNLIGLLMFLVFQNTTSIFIWRILSGLGMSFSYLSVIKAISLFLPKNKIGVAIGITGLVVMPAGIISQTPLFMFLTKVGLSPWIILDISFGVATMILLSLLPSIHNSYSHHKEKLPLSDFLNRQNISISIYAACANFPLFIFGATFGIDFFSNAFAINLTSASILVSFIYIGDMTGGVFWGFISDKLSDRASMLKFAILLYFVSSILIILNSVFQSLLIGGFACYLIGLSTSSQTIAYSIIIEKNRQINTAKAASIMSFASVALGAFSQYYYGKFSSLKIIHNGSFLLIVTLIMALSLIFFYKKSDAYILSMQRKS